MVTDKLIKKEFFISPQSYISLRNYISRLYVTHNVRSSVSEIARLAVNEFLDKIKDPKTKARYDEHFKAGPKEKIK